MSLLKLSQECVDAAHGRFPGVEPGVKRKDRPAGISVFENAILENYFAKAYWWTPGVWFIPVIGYGLYRGVIDASTGGVRTAGYFAGGLLLWTLVEYLLHRFYFHLPAKNDAQKMEAFLRHGYHHDFPDDPKRLVMPPIISWPLAVLFFYGYRAMFGVHAVWPVFAGTVLGYLAYDWIHYYTHHGRPKGGVGKFLRRVHMQHHFGAGDTYFGVSSPLWDLVFGTYRPLKSAASNAALARGGH